MSWQWGVRFATNCTNVFVTLLVGLIIDFQSLSHESAELDREAIDNLNQPIGRGHPPKAVSKKHAVANTTSSRHGRPANWTPIGSLSLVVPARITATGQPLRLCVMV